MRLTAARIEVREHPTGVRLASYDGTFELDMLKRWAREGGSVYAVRNDGVVLGVLAPSLEKAQKCRKAVAKGQEAGALAASLKRSGRKLGRLMAASRSFKDMGLDAAVGMLHTMGEAV